MSIGCTFEAIDRRSATIDAVGAFRPVKTYRCLAPYAAAHQWQIYRDFATTTGIDIGVRWTPLAYGHAAYEDVNVFCSSININEDTGTDNRQWTIDALFEPAEDGAFGPEAIPDPGDELNAPIRIEHGEWVEQFVEPFDKDGKWMLNTAGDFYADYQPEEVHHPLIRISRYERSFNPTTASQYRDTVNDADWTFRGILFNARSTKLVSWTANEMWHQDKGLYFDVRYEIAVRWRNGAWNGGTGDSGQGWDVRVPNVGYRQLLSGQLIAILDGNSQVASPVPLQASGVAYTLPLTPTTAMPMRTYRKLRETNFADLKLPAA